MHLLFFKYYFSFIQHPTIVNPILNSIEEISIKAEKVLEDMFTLGRIQDRYLILEVSIKYEISACFIL